jgi:hypothetical protein
MQPAFDRDCLLMAQLCAPDGKEWMTATGCEAIASIWQLLQAELSHSRDLA